MEQEIQLNGHNKQEYPPMHTAEHILNQTMIRMFGCERSKNTHIERKKSKCDYILSVEPTAEMITEIENRVNEVIGQDLPVTTCFVTREEVPEGVDLSKLPEDASLYIFYWIYNYSHHTRQNNIGYNVLYLFHISIIQQFSIRPRINYLTGQCSKQQTICHCHYSQLHS